MTLAEQIYEEAKTMPELKQQEVLEFLLFVKQRERKALKQEMDDIIQENLEALRVLAQ